ncbi:MAG TPA: helix-turn-helix domain-containing protein [Erysipelotrichaceae bacterium]|jgi:transposase-like protein|nr:helix-turn-helix domain-containing protein [Erysipelotrichaceae bacterium]
MGRKPKISYEEKIQAVEDYLSGKDSAANIARRLNSGKGGDNKIRLWAREYKTNGPEALISKRRNSSYTKEFKQMVVEEYQEGEGSIENLAIKHQIPAASTILNWISKYNNLRELKDYNPRPEVYTKMAYRKKTTLEERKEIVQYCLDNNRDYKTTASRYDVSYSQVYSWVRKYLSEGEEGLSDCRGKRKDESQLTELEKYQRKVKILEATVKELQMERELLKKVQEIERRRSFQKRKMK